MDISGTLLEELCCPLCGANDNSPYAFENKIVLGKELQFGLNRCKHCTMHYVSPRLSEFAQIQYYARDYTVSTLSGARHSDPTIGIEEYQQFERYVIHCLGNGGNLLDVGCGVGNFISQMKKHGKYHIKGIEISPQAAEMGRNGGFEIDVSTIENYSSKENDLDGIIMLYVLEHVRDPQTTMSAAYKLLKTGGYLFLAVPNYRYLHLVYETIASKILRFGKVTLYPEEHLQNFTPVTLKNIAQKVGFTVVAHNCAHPLLIGSQSVRHIKKCMYYVVKNIARIGYNLGGIHYILKK